jgi:hypothetical protein
MLHITSQNCAQVSERKWTVESSVTRLFQSMSLQSVVSVYSGHIAILSLRLFLLPLSLFPPSHPQSPPITLAEAHEEVIELYHKVLLQIFMRVVETYLPFLNQPFTASHML